MNRRGFLKHLGGLAALTALTLTPKRIIEAAEKSATTENALDSRDLFQRPGKVYELPPPPMSVSATASAGGTMNPALRALYDDRLQQAHLRIANDLEKKVFDTDFGKIQVAPKIGPVGGWGNLFGDDGDPSKWIDLESFYVAGDGLRGDMGYQSRMRAIEQFNRRMKHRRDKFNKILMVQEGALYPDPHFVKPEPMEVQ